MDILTSNDRIGHYPKSWYAASIEHRALFPTVVGEVCCDVCIIGGGFAAQPSEKELVEGLVRNNYAVADSKFVVNYFRFSEDRRMLFGGGESYDYRFPKDIARLVRKPMTKIFPQLSNVQIDYAWGGTLGITMNRMPHFSRISGNTVSISGYSGHGVAMATLVGN